MDPGGEGARSAEVMVQPRATTFSAHVNFSNNTVQVPAGYVNDVGLAFGRGELNFGWNQDNTANARDRDRSSSPDELHDSLNHLQLPNNPNAVWRIAVPNGTYTVHLLAGDPDTIDSVYRLNVNGMLAVGGTPTTSNHWFDGTVTVTVTDGQIVVGNAADRRTTRSTRSTSPRSPLRPRPPGPKPNRPHGRSPAGRCRLPTDGQAARPFSPTPSPRRH